MIWIQTIHAQPDSLTLPRLGGLMAAIPLRDAFNERVGLFESTENHMQSERRSLADIPYLIYLLGFCRPIQLPSSKKHPNLPTCI
jgi:hypothetical protein